MRTSRLWALVVAGLMLPIAGCRGVAPTQDRDSGGGGFWRDMIYDAAGGRISDPPADYNPSNPNALDRFRR